jgi:hypothetical protein
MKDDDPNLAFDAGPADSELATQPVNKITWALAGRVTDPGRYMFTFGWLTITANDLAIWQAYPNAAFTLIRTLTSPPAKTDDEPIGEEFRLGTFELRTGANYSAGEK